ncbi:hypothetical protein NUW58_g7964 [Xylaria curta]|uniref:Uncharacterized protein n=1 Tax=Xylaria curta TaxID=42375 RepID=A0ACC1NDP9_9PEZI|nr:hypothetical protein NUW58_g7964 [Xylaria curta]
MEPTLPKIRRRKPIWSHGIAAPAPAQLGGRSTAPQDDSHSTAANPAWRDVIMFNIIGLTWNEDTPAHEVAAIHERLTNDLAQRLKDISPGAGGYLNEGDVMDPEWADSFYGANYERLLQIKKRVDPNGLFWAPTAVGSEDWYVTGQEPYITTQFGRLCRK